MYLNCDLNAHFSKEIRLYLRNFRPIGVLCKFAHRLVQLGDVLRILQVFGSKVVQLFVAQVSLQALLFTVSQIRDSDLSVFGVIPVLELIPHYVAKSTLWAPGAHDTVGGNDEVRSV